MTRLTPQDKLTRLESVLGFQPSDDGRAFLLLVDTPDGPLNLEVTEHSVKKLLAGVMQASVACAARRSDMPSIGDSDPAGSLYLPASDLQVLPVKGAHKRLVIRTGIVDLSVMIHSPELAAALVWALQD